MTVFFTADHHFGHANIIKYCNRPHKEVWEMNDHLIERWNEVVGREDFVYYIGDFAFMGRKEKSTLFNQLNGFKYLIPGNHDNTATKQLPWVAVSPYLECTPRNKVNLVLCHYPIESWNGMHRGSIMLHGHSHGKARPLERRVDVGVDNWDFAPVSLDQILEKVMSNGD